MMPTPMVMRVCLVFMGGSSVGVVPGRCPIAEVIVRRTREAAVGRM
jgi:hypothetical protein